MRASDISPEYPLLGFLSQSPSHGYDLHRSLEEELQGVWDLSQSQVYNILKRLETNGDVHAEIQEQESAPTRRLLSLTPSGKERFETWLREPTPGSVRALRMEFLARLYFCRLRSAQFAIDMVENQKDGLKQDLQNLRRIYDERPLHGNLSRLSLQLRIRQLHSCLEWLDDCRSSIEL